MRIGQETKSNTCCIIVELWDVTNTNYSKKEARLRALQRVQETLDYNYTVKEINDKLKHLRSYYARELAKVNKSKKSGACTDIYRSKWAYFNTLDGFLRPQITPRKPVSILNSSLKESEQEDYDENDDEEELFGRETPQEPRPILPKKRRVTEHKDVVAGAVSVLSQLKTRNTAATPPTVENTQNEDDDLVFAKYLSTELRKVKNPRIKNNLKLKLQTLIFDAQMEDANV